MGKKIKIFLTLALSAIILMMTSVKSVAPVAENSNDSQNINLSASEEFSPINKIIEEKNYNGKSLQLFLNNEINFYPPYTYQD